MKFAPPPPTLCRFFFFTPLSPSRRENEYCRLLHLFVFSTFVCGSRKTTEEPDSKQSSVKREEGLEEKKTNKKKNSNHCLRLTNVTKAAQGTNKVRKKTNNILFSNMHASPQKRHRLGVSLLDELFDPNCGTSPRRRGRRHRALVFQSERN